MLQTLRQNEITALRRLANLRSVSASIIIHLELTKDEVAEALGTLEGNRAAQTNLADILAAFRFKTHALRRVYDAKCPKTFCDATDTFPHMLECYHLEYDVQKGPTAVPFLVRMAEIAELLKGQPRIPYREMVATGTRTRDSLPAVERGSPEEL